MNFLSSAEVSLDVDADRDGVVEKNNPHKVTLDKYAFTSSLAATYGSNEEIKSV